MSCVHQRACRQCDLIDMGVELYVLAGCRIDDCVGGADGVIGVKG